MSGLPPGFKVVDSPTGGSTSDLPPGYKVKSVPASNDMPAGFAAITPTPKLGTQYDPYITQSASANGVDPALMRAVIGRESGGDPNAKSPTGARGVMQFEPATFQGLMGPGADISDPKQNIEAGARYLAQLSKQFKGDKRLILAAYNAGPGAVSKAGDVPNISETKSYVANVMNDYNQLQSKPVKPMEAGIIPEPVAKVAAKAAGQYSKGMTPGQIARADLPGGHPIARAEAKAVSALNFIRNHPFEAFGTGQRAVGGFVDAMAQHKDLKSAYEEVKKYALHPTAAVQEQLDSALEADAHLPAHTQVNMMIDKMAPKSVQKPLKALIGGAEDFAVETVTDPMNLLPIGKLGEGIGVGLKSMHAAAKAAGVGNLFAHLPKVSSHITDIADSIKHAFKTRPELDQFMDAENKTKRYAIENSESGRAARWAHEDRDIVKDTQKSVDRFTNHYAPLLGRAPAVNIPILSPEQRASLFAGYRKQITEKNIATRSAASLSMKPGVQASWSKIPLQPEAAVTLDPKMEKLFGVTRFLGNAQVQMIPFPHALWNVGMLTYLNGGPMAFMRGMGHMVHSIPPTLVDRMNEIGASASYTHDAEGPLGALNAFASHIEQSWRAGLLETVDKRLGPSRHAADELMKGQLVNDAAGDYKNHNAFVQTFMALGGPFVSYGLGIVPKTYAKAAIQAPQRLQQVRRAQEDVQRNRPDHGANKLDIGGAANEGDQFVKNPAKYVISPSRAGIIGDIAQQAYSMDHPGISEVLDGFAQAIYPPYAIMHEFGDIAAGRGLPTSGKKGEKAYEHSTLSDKLAETMLKFFTTVHYQRPQSASQQKAEANAPYRRP
jgi:Transglycosylase SLT domain